MRKRIQAQHKYIVMGKYNITFCTNRYIPILEASTWIDFIGPDVKQQQIAALQINKVIFFVSPLGYLWFVYLRCFLELLM